jgi:uncharacterized protein (DUF1697 family)
LPKQRFIATMNRSAGLQKARNMHADGNLLLKELNGWSKEVIAKLHSESNPPFFRWFDFSHTIFMTKRQSVYKEIVTFHSHF